jgi:hypothetical protein
MKAYEIAQAFADIFAADEVIDGYFATEQSGKTLTRPALIFECSTRALNGTTIGSHVSPANVAPPSNAGPPFSPFALASPGGTRFQSHAQDEACYSSHTESMSTNSPIVSGPLARSQSSRVLADKQTLAPQGEPFCFTRRPGTSLTPSMRRRWFCRDSHRLDGTGLCDGQSQFAWCAIDSVQ